MLRQAVRSLGIPVVALSLSMEALAIVPSATAAPTSETIQTTTARNCNTYAHPKFPLPKGWYFGPKKGPKHSVSGYYSHRKDLCKWQQRMRDLGYTQIGTPDGLYGDQTRAVAVKFQNDRGLEPDGLIGKKTWEAAYKNWVSPCTGGIKLPCPV